jgi:hypothetical protein
MQHEQRARRAPEQCEHQPVRVEAVSPEVHLSIPTRQARAVPEPAAGVRLGREVKSIVRL